LGFSGFGAVAAEAAHAVASGPFRRVDGLVGVVDERIDVRRLVVNGTLMVRLIGALPLPGSMVIASMA